MDSTKYKQWLEQKGIQGNSLYQYTNTATNFQDFIDATHIKIEINAIELFLSQRKGAYFRKTKSMLVKYIEFLGEHELAFKVKELTE